MLHAKQHLDTANSQSLAHSAEFFKQTREEGTWNHDSVYLIVLREEGSVINHGLYTSTLYGDSLGSLDTIATLIDKLKDAGDEAVCEPYTYGDVSRQACAVEYEPLQSFQGGASTKNILVGGFDHDVEEGIVPLVCPKYEPAVTAAEVQERQTRESLEDFVEGAIIRYSDALGLLTEDREEFARILQCFSKPGPWKSGSIYLFVMTADTTVILNGLNPELGGSPFQDVFDEDGVDIGKEIIDTAGTDGADGFVEYKWDDPSENGDEVTGSGRSPGTSPKISYVKGTSFPTSARPDTVYIFGSGIYPKDDDSDNDGCAIAGAGNEPGSIVFNMFLITLSMVLAVSLARFRRK